LTTDSDAVFSLCKLIRCGGKVNRGRKISENSDLCLFFAACDRLSLIY